MTIMSDHAQLLSTGVRHHQSGQLEQALQIYRQVVTAQPDNAHARNLLGAVCINLKQFDEAATHLAEAVRLNPQHNAAHDNLGVLLARQGRYDEAIASFERALAISPNQPLTLTNLAGALMRSQRIAEAIEAYQRAVALAPDALRAHTELAEALMRQNRSAEAIEHWRHVARLEPLDPRAHFERAALLAQAGRPDEAKAEYRETLRLKPDSAEACVNLGGLCIASGDLDEAIDLFRRAIQMRPRFAEAHLNLGAALSRQGKSAEAVDVLGQAIRLKPKLSGAHNNLGIALADQARFAEAVLSYERAIALQSDNLDALYNMGLALLRQNKIASALAQFERAIALRPDFAKAHHNRAAALLLSENFEQGLAEYEWRFRSPDYPPFRMQWPLWNGEPLQGRTIVLLAEQGMGDTIQFIRYASLFEDRGARVILGCNKSLHAVLARTPGVDEWVAPGMPSPSADCCVPLMSLPHRFGTTLDTIPAEVPYVFADPGRIDAWRQRLGACDGFKIGIAWQGNRKAPGDRFRSIPLTEFAPLASVPGVRLISLQKGAGVEQLAEVRDAWPITDFPDALDAEGDAFVDTAAVMKNLDLVITSDTATAHLAGALGVPVWVALSFVPDWRWMLKREDSPWYPTMRLFRQAQWLQWRDVFGRMAELVAALADGDSQPPKLL